MSAVLDMGRAQRDVVLVPRIAIAALLSLWLHALLIAWSPRMPLFDKREPAPPLIAYLKKAPTNIEPASRKSRPAELP